MTPDVMHCRRLLRLVIACSLASSPPVPAEPAIEEIVVTATRDEPAAPPRAPVTTRNAEDIARLQADDLFAVLQDVPGLSVNGGPRASGMKFNIRGFSDTEDVIVEIDGIARSFEKYRFGSGVFVEPELLAEIRVERSPSILRGAGALGGSVSARTREAAELLAPEARFGMLAKSAYATNDDEVHLSMSAFGTPTASLGLLASASRRLGNDQRLPDGTHLMDSSTDSRSHLLKASWQITDTTGLRAGLIDYSDTGRQPYDATGGQPGFFGTVQRAIDDRTVFVELRQIGPAPWLDATATVGQVDTLMEDLHRPGETPFANAVTGNVVDTFDYRTLVARFDETARFPHLALAPTLRVGAQLIDGERDIARVTENQSVNQSLYPGGFNAAQPPGSRRSLGLYLQGEVTLEPVTVSAGLRWNRYVSTATGGSAELLRSLDEETRIAARKLTPAFGIEWELQPGRLAWFYTYSEAFRPPLIDEYFMQGAFSRCNPARLGSLAPVSRICGRLYEPEESSTHETGLRLRTGLADLPAQLSLRLSVFHTDVRHTLESISVVGAGEIGQPGREHREGLEIEAEATVHNWFARLGWSSVRGRERRPDGSSPLYELPGDHLSVMLGGRWLDDRFELGYRLEDIGAREVYASSGDTPERQEGYRLHGAFATLYFSDHLVLRLSGDNLTNTRYRLNDGFGGAPGSEAPGRNLRLSTMIRF